MRKGRARKGEAVNWDKPVWEPLIGLVGFEVTGHFMWMYEAELRDRTKIEAYKHYDLRQYIFLDDFARAFVFEGEDKYRRCDGSSIVFRMFIDLREMRGGTDRQVEALYKAYERASDHDEYLREVVDCDHNGHKDGDQGASRQFDRDDEARSTG